MWRDGGKFATKGLDLASKEEIISRKGTPL